MNPGSGSQPLVFFCQTKPDLFLYKNGGSRIKGLTSTGKSLNFNFTGTGVSGLYWPPIEACAVTVQSPPNGG